MSNVVEAEVLNVSRQLLETIDRGDWDAYAKLCDPTLSCFEPEALGQLVEGLPFHKFYFDMPGSPTKPPKQSTIASPKVRVMGDAAVVTYVRVVQKIVSDGSPVCVAIEETRVWQKKDGQWLHVHFHRSAPGK